MWLFRFLVFIILIASMARCREKGSGPVFSGANWAAWKQMAAAKKYDSLYNAVEQYTGNCFAANNPKETLDSALVLYDWLKTTPSLQKKYALLLYRNRESIAQNDTARRRFYRLFTDKYTEDHFREMVDPEFIEIAEYFITLQKNDTALDVDQLLRFKNELGIIYQIAGDLKKTAGYYNQVYDYDYKHVYDNGRTDTRYIPGSVMNLAKLLNELGLPDSSRKLIQYTLSLGITSHYDLCGLYILQAEAELANKNFTAVPQILQRAEQQIPLILSDKDEEGVADRAANTARMQERYADLLDVQLATAAAQQAYMQAIVLSRQKIRVLLQGGDGYHKRQTGKTLLQLGSAFNQLQQHDSALWYFHQALYTVTQVDSANVFALPEAGNIYAENTLMDALDSLAVLYDRQYTQTRDIQFTRLALQARELAFAAERQLFEAFTYDESMQTQLRNSKKRSAYSLQNCYTLWQATHAPNWVEAAFRVSENSRATILLHSVKRNNALAAIQLSDTGLAKLNRIKLQVIGLEQRRNTTTDAILRDSLKRVLQTLQQDLEAREYALRKKYPDWKRSGSDTAQLHIHFLQKKLLNRYDALVQYFTTDSLAIVCWLTSNNRMGMQRLSTAELALVQNYLQNGVRSPVLFSRNRDAFYELAASCTRAVLPEDLRKAIAGGHLQKMVVVPDGVFSLLPFEALTPEPRKYLLEQCVVYNGFSISTLLANAEQKQTPATTEAAVFAPYTHEAYHNKPQLVFSHYEVEEIENRFGRETRSFTRAQASLQHFQQALANSRILHLATHAAAASGEEPCIYFSDSILYMKQLYAAHTPASLVVLSGCETGIGVPDPTEGPLSLARAFYYAGAKNVINSLWKIDDSATAAIFKSFYTHYKNGEAGSVLNHAKRHYLETHTGRQSAPYYWATLVHTGLDTPPANAGGGMKRWLWGISAGILVMLLLFAGRRFRKRRLL